MEKAEFGAFGILCLVNE